MRTRLVSIAAAVACAVLCVAGSAGASTQLPASIRPAASTQLPASIRPVVSPRPAFSPSDGSIVVALWCASASTCMAAGYFWSMAATGLAPLAEHWNGHHWAFQRADNPTGAQETFLQAIACPSAKSCIATGYYSNSSGTDVPLAEHWNGHSWRVQPMPAPAHALGTILTAMSCPAATACTAVGYSENKADVTMALAEHWNGHHWSIEQPASPGGKLGTFPQGVSCSSVSACTLVGLYANSKDHSEPLAERWNGHRWQAQHVPAAAGSLNGGLFAVACQATACTAVGTFGDDSGASLPLAERWNGHRWKAQHAPGPSGSTTGLLQGVSCHTATACTAVGNYASKSSAVLPLAEHWNGHRWLIQKTPGLPSGGTNADLPAIRCPSVTNCIAVGYFTDKAGIRKTLAEHWNGHHWTRQATPDPAS